MQSHMHEDTADKQMGTDQQQPKTSVYNKPTWEVYLPSWRFVDQIFMCYVVSYRVMLGAGGGGLGSGPY